MALSLVLDHAQTRVASPRIGVLAQGGFEGGRGGLSDGWQPYLNVDTWIEPARKAGLLLPLPLTPEWQTVATGDYARLALGAFGLTAGSGGWIQNGTRLDNPAGMSANAVTTATYGANRGVYVACFNYDPGAGEGKLIDLGWSNAGDGSAGVAATIWRGGLIEIYKGGSRVGTLRMDGRGDGGKAVGYAAYLFIPAPPRGLLVFALHTFGADYHTFADLDPAGASNIVLPDEKLWFDVPAGSVSVEIAPIRFKTSGTLVSKTLGIARARDGSDAAETPEPIWARLDASSSATLDLRKLDLSAAVANADLQCRARISLTGPGTHSPFVWAAVAGWDARTAQTPAASVELMPDVPQDLTLSVPESPSGVRVAWSTLGTPAGITGYLTQSNRPCRLRLGLIDVVDGQTEPPDEERAAYAEARLSFHAARDAWKRLEDARFIDPYPLDGLTLTDAIIRVMGHAGFAAAALDIETDAFTLPIPEAPALGDWAALIESGDTAADWIERLIETYAATWIFGFVPTASGIRFRAGSPTHWGTSAVATIYPDIATAIAQEPGTPEATLRKRLYRSLRHQWLEPEANEIRVTGFDPATGRPFQAFWRDAAGQDPTTPVGSRGQSWLGTPRIYGLADPIVTSPAAAVRGVERLRDRLGSVRKMYEFDSDLLLSSGGVPVWRGQVVNLYGEGLVRIQSLEARFLIDHAASGWRQYPTRYTAVAGAGSYLSARGAGTSLGELQASHAERVAAGTQVRGGFRGEQMVRVSPRDRILVT